MPEPTEAMVAVAEAISATRAKPGLRLADLSEYGRQRALIEARAALAVSPGCRGAELLAEIKQAFTDAELEAVKGEGTWKDSHCRLLNRLRPLLIGVT